MTIQSVEADYEAHETVWAIASDLTVRVPTEKLMDTFYPHTELRRPLTGTDELFDVSKVWDLIGG